MKNLGITSSPTAPLSPNAAHRVRNERDRKFMELYDEAKHRQDRQQKVQAELLDKECTFKPHLITKDSKLT